MSRSRLPTLTIRHFGHRRFVGVVVNRIVRRNVFSPVSCPNTMYIHRTYMRFYEFIFSSVRLFVRRVRVTRFLRVRFRRQGTAVLDDRFARSLFECFVVTRFFRRIFPIRFGVDFYLGFVALGGVIFVRCYPPPFRPYGGSSRLHIRDRSRDSSISTSIGDTF